MQRLRVVFFGTPQFALPIVRMLHEHEELVAVVTQKDRPRGRGRKLAPPPVKEWAEGAGVECVQPERLKDDEFVSWLESKKPDVICVAAYGKIIPKEILELPELGCINVHASLLPRWRGAAPVNWAIIAGDEMTGITIMQMDEGLDTGPILLQVETGIEPHERAGELSQRLAELGAKALHEALQRLKRGELEPKPQPEEGATYAPPITKEMAKIDWTKPARDIVNLVRGLHPSPCAYTLVGGKRLKVHRARIESEDSGGAPPGTVISAERSIVVAAGEGAVELTEVQFEGKRAMSAEEFLRGQRIGAGIRLGE